MTGNNDLDEGKFYDVKKEIYRLTDRVFAALAKCYEVKASSSFAILDKLYKKEVISSEARDNLASASAIAIKLRMSNYLRAGKQGEQLSSNSSEDTVLADEELFHFFFVAIPLYDDLRQFKTSGNLPSSLENRSFFDDSPMTMGHIYCRLLKYNEAMKCYERALQDDPGNLSAEIRRIRVALFATHNPEESDKIRESLDNLLRKIDQNFSQLDDNDTETIPKFSPLIDRVDMEDCQQLIEGLLFASEIYYCEKYFAVAETIQAQCLISSKTKPKELLILKSAFLKYSSEHRVQQREIDEVVSQLNSFIVEEGVSTKSIVWLNRLGEFLFNQDKMDMAYRCFQRALSMGHSLYGTRPNVNSITSLRFLGMIASNLSMYAESKFYHESLVNLFAIESFGGMIPMLLIKRTYLQLALLSSAMGRTTDEGLGYVKNGLKVGTGTKSEKELHFDCLLYCELATILHSNQSPEQAWKAAQDAQACLRNSTVGQPRSDSEEMIRAVVATLCQIEKTKEGVELLKELLQKFTVDSKVREKVFCLKALGELWLEQGLAPDAETCYTQAMDIAAEHGGDIFDRLDCLIGISKAVVLKGSVTELELFLGIAMWFYISSQKRDHH
jgi:tetratricopeptide (TPR) repeat protein